MSDEIKPALTASEWTQHLSGNSGDVDDAVEWASRKVAETIMSSGPNRHALAALCLYGQPFGFTREDIEMLRGIGRGGDYGDWGGLFESLTQRIAALLPPEEK